MPLHREQTRSATEGLHGVIALSYPTVLDMQTHASPTGQGWDAVAAVDLIEGLVAKIAADDSLWVLEKNDAGTLTWAAFRPEISVANPADLGVVAAPGVATSLSPSDHVHARPDYTDGSVLDGDKVDLSLALTFITPNAGIAEADDVGDLAAIVKGVDTALGARIAGSTGATTDRILLADGTGGKTAKAGTLTEASIAALSSAVAGDLATHEADLANPHVVTAAQLGAVVGSTGAVTDRILLANGTGGGSLKASTVLLADLVTDATHTADILSVVGDLASHEADLANPHATSIANIGPGTLTNLNAAVGVTVASLGTSLPQALGSSAQVGLSKAASPQDHVHARDNYTSGAILDGDKIDIDFTPTNYTPDAGIAEADDVDDLSAHLKGVDAELGTLGGGAGDLAAHVIETNPHPNQIGDNLTISFVPTFYDREGVPVDSVASHLLGIDNKAEELNEALGIQGLHTTQINNHQNVSLDPHSHIPWNRIGGGEVDLQDMIATITDSDSEWEFTYVYGGGFEPSVTAPLAPAAAPGSAQGAARYDHVHARDDYTNGGILDGDLIDLTYVPTNYTRTTAGNAAVDVKDLAANFAGIDNALATALAGGIGGTTGASDDVLVVSSGTGGSTIAPSSVTGAALAAHIGATAANPHGTSFANLVDGTLAQLNARVTGATLGSQATVAPLTIGGAASIGTSPRYAREDHVHANTGLATDVELAAHTEVDTNPHDTSIENLVSGTLAQLNANIVGATLGSLATVAPADPGVTATVGVSAQAARADHRHSVPREAIIEVLVPVVPSGQGNGYANLPLWDSTAVKARVLNYDYGGSDMTVDIRKSTTPASSILLGGAQDVPEGPSFEAVTLDLVASPTFDEGGNTQVAVQIDFPADAVSVSGLGIRVAIYLVER